MAALGLPALRFLTTSDRMERLLLLALADATAKAVDELQRQLAHHVIETLAKAVR